MFTEESHSIQNRSSQTALIQRYVLIGLLVLAVGLLAWNLLRPAPKFTYKVINVQAQFNNKPSTETGSQINNADLSSTSIGIKDEELTILGNEGWGLVGTFLEMETSHPNYGNSTYVTGLQPNVRPQRAVMIFKKQL